MSFFPAGYSSGDTFGVAGDGGPDCEYCGLEITSGPDCTRDDCPGEVLGCNVMTFRGSHNENAGNFGPDEYCEEPVVPGTEQCAGHQYDVDEPNFVEFAREYGEPW